MPTYTRNRTPTQPNAARHAVNKVPSASSACICITKSPLPIFHWHDYSHIVLIRERRLLVESCIRRNARDMLEQCFQRKKGTAQQYSCTLACYQVPRNKATEVSTPLTWANARTCTCARASFHNGHACAHVPVYTIDIRVRTCQFIQWTCVGDDVRLPDQSSVSDTSTACKYRTTSKWPDMSLSNSTKNNQWPTTLVAPVVISELKHDHSRRVNDDGPTRRNPE
jgi:hypothetical protein